MLVTDKLLKGLAAQGANMGKTELRHRHKLNGILAAWHHGSGLHRFRKIEKLAEEHFGEGWLNIGQAKDDIFGVLAAGTTVGAIAEAFVIVSAANRFMPTPALKALPPEEFERICEDSHPRDLPQYFQPQDILLVVAQSPERVCIFTQRLQIPGFLLIGEPDIRCGPQAGFNGRLKIYGGEIPRDIAESIKAFMASKGIQ